MVGVSLAAAHVPDGGVGAGYGKAADATVGVLQTSINDAGLNQVLLGQFCLPPLAAQTIPSGAWALAFGASRSINSQAATFSAAIYVVRAGVLVGTIFDNTIPATFPGSATEAATSLNLSGAAVTVLDGDVLVVELWVLGIVGGTIYYDGTVQRSATDNAANLLAPAVLALQSSALTDALTNTGISVQTFTDADLEALLNTGISVETMAELGSEAIVNTAIDVSTLTDAGVEVAANTATNVDTLTDRGIEVPVNTAVSVQSFADTGLEVLAGSSLGSHSFADVAIDASTSLGIQVGSLVDLLTLAEALTTLAVNVQSVAELGLDVLASTGVSVEALTDALTDVLAQVAVSLGSALETAQEGSTGLSGGVQGLGEVAIEGLTLSTAVSSFVDLIEIEVDVLVSLMAQAGSIGETSLDALDQIAASMNTVIDLAIDVLSELGISISTIGDFVFDPSAPVTDALTSIAILVSLIEDSGFALGGSGEGSHVFRSGMAARQRARMAAHRRALAALEKQAESVLLSDTLPKSYPVGAQKAYQEFQNFYGVDEGKRIFMQKALEQGIGASVPAKIANIYKTGAHIDKTKKLDVRVQVNSRSGPSVKVFSRSSGVKIVKR